MTEEEKTELTAINVAEFFEAVRMVKTYDQYYVGRMRVAA